MIAKSKILSTLAPHLMRPKPTQAQSQVQRQDQNQNQNQAQNVEVKIFPNVTEYKPEEKVDDSRIIDLETRCSYLNCVVEVYDRITELMKEFDSKNEMIIREEDLKFIIKNLSGCDDVDIQFKEGGCLGLCSRKVDKIHLIYGDVLYNMKYSSETLINFLKNKQISYKEVL